jgi:hypothetical protein
MGFMPSQKTAIIDKDRFVYTIHMVVVISFSICLISLVTVKAFPLVEEHLHKKINTRIFP